MSSEIAKRNLNIRQCILYEFCKDEDHINIRDNIRLVFNEKEITDRTIKNWVDKFKAGNFNLEDKDRSGRPRKVQPEIFEEYVDEHHYSSQYDIASELGVTPKTIRKYKSESDFLQIFGRKIPHALTEDQKQQRYMLSAMLYKIFVNKDIIKDIITVDESWIIYDQEDKLLQFVRVGEEPEPYVKDKAVRSKKIMMVIFWYSKGLIHYDFLEHGKSFNSGFYIDQIITANEKLRIGKSKGIQEKTFYFLQDNARPHTALFSLCQIMDVKWECLPHPPYSPDLSPCDFYLFPRLKQQLKPGDFKDEDVLKNKIGQYFDSQNEEFWFKPFNDLIDRWGKVMDANGDYFKE